MIGNGIEVTLPPSPRLERLRQQLEEARRERDEAARAWGKFDVQRQRADSAAQRRELQSASDEAYAKQGAAERRINDLTAELAAREYEVAGLVHGRGLLSDELERGGNAPVGDFTIMSMGQQPQRAREVVEDELLATTYRLALFTDSEEIMEQAVALDQRIKDSRPYITLQQNYILRRSDNRILSEQQFNAEALSEADKRGINKYPKGSRIERSEAAKVGLLEMEEAQA